MRTRFVVFQLRPRSIFLLILPCVGSLRTPIGNLIPQGRGWMARGEWFILPISRRGVVWESVLALALFRRRRWVDEGADEVANGAGEGGWGGLGRGPLRDLDPAFDHVLVG